MRSEEKYMYKTIRFPVTCRLFGRRSSGSDRRRRLEHVVEQEQETERRHLQMFDCRAADCSGAAAKSSAVGLMNICTAAPHATRSQLRRHLAETFRTAQTFNLQRGSAVSRMGDIVD